MKRIIYISVISFIMVFSYSASFCEEEKNLKAVKGILDLRQKLKNPGILTLDGEWEFYWKELLSPESLKNPQKKLEPSFQYVPSDWGSYFLNGQQLPDEGYATYRLKILLPENENIYAINIPKIYSSYKLWINGKIVSENGTVSVRPHPEFFKLFRDTVYFSHKGGQLEIVVQTSSYSSRVQGINGSLEMGDSKTVRMENRKKTALYIILSGAIAAMVFYNIMLFAIFRNYITPLCFSAFGSIILINYIIEINLNLGKILPHLPFDIEEKMQIAIICLLGTTILNYINNLFNKQVPGWMILGSRIFSVLYILSVAMLPIRFNNLLWSTVLFYLSLVSVYILVYLFFKSLKRNFYSLVTLFSFSILVLSAVYGLLKNSIFQPDFSQAIYGAIIFMIIQTLLITRKFQTAFHNIEVISEKLNETNIELQKSFSEMETKVKERTEDIRLTNMKLKIIFDSVYNGIIISDFNGTILEVNKKIADLFNEPQEKIVNTSVFQLISYPRRGETFSVYWVKAISGETPVFEFYLDNLPGKNHIIAEIYLKKIDWDNQDVLLITIRDITGEKKSIKSLKDSEEKFRQLSNATFEGITIHDNNMILDINNEMAKMLDYNSSELIGKSILDFIIQDHHKIVASAIKEGKDASYETVLIKKNGERINVEVLSKPFIYNGKNVRVAAIRLKHD